MSDLADGTAAAAAGYSLTQQDRGSGSRDIRYTSTYEKYLSGGSGAGFMFRATGESSVSQAAADATALAALNAQRQMRYNGATNIHGDAYVEDVT